MGMAYLYPLPHLLVIHILGSLLSMTMLKQMVFCLALNTVNIVLAMAANKVTGISIST